ncbi:hypothetical protein BC567DRAFT_38017 [Phyllosticta citribraziliensis]
MLWNGFLAALAVPVYPSVLYVVVATRLVRTAWTLVGVRVVALQILLREYVDAAGVGVCRIELVFLGYVREFIEAVGIQSQLEFDLLSQACQQTQFKTQLTMYVE